MLLDLTSLSKSFFKLKHMGLLAACWTIAGEGLNQCAFARFTQPYDKTFAKTGIYWVGDIHPKLCDIHDNFGAPLPLLQFPDSLSQ